MSFRSIAAKNLVFRTVAVLIVAGACLVTPGPTTYLLRAQPPRILGRPNLRVARRSPEKCVTLPLIYNEKREDKE
jgi:hypothetical protein